MPPASVTERTAGQFPTQFVGNSDGLVPQHMKHMPSTESPPTVNCKTAASQACWEINVVLVLMVLAGFLILALFYCVFHLWHKLHLVQAGNSLEYFGFYHMANYSLKQIYEPPGLASVDTDRTPEEVPSCSPPPTVVPNHPLIPSLLHSPPPLLSQSPSAVPLPHPFIYTTPPSPQSDAEVYSRIGNLQPSRLSSVSQTQVVLFEHSSL
ncbi:hypothetical protein C0J45_13351 [Silurus meridionalis]|nr:hypothetical protein C0J45_13351 [Silurus meridionalis]